MSSQSIVWRMTVFVTASTVSLGGMPPLRAAPPPIPTPAEPSARVGQLARITGSVSFHTADEDHWEPAVLNAPVATGDVLWTEPGAQADVAVAANRIAMDGQTELDMTTLDDHSLVAATPQGDVYLRLDDVPSGDTYAVQTPRGVVQITAAGRYEIVAGDTEHPTLVTVVDGSAQVTGGSSTLTVGPRQTASITGTSAFQGSVGPMAQDPFLTKMLAQERPAPRQTVAVSRVVQQMTGSEVLYQYGTWDSTPDYGSVWYPQVADDWVPYRDGQWSYVAPWGWTWVDSAPWGFAPSHYGRWAHIGHRWGWVPVDPGVQAYQTPVYAPALVSFIGIGVGVGLAAHAFDGGRGSVGWVPLGPNEPYYPPYRAGAGYVRRLNAGAVRDVDRVVTEESIRAHAAGGERSRGMQNFANRAGATMVPAAAMVGSRPMRGVAQAVPAAQFDQVRPIGADAVRPTAATAGVTPSVARRFNFAPAPRTAPGPAIAAGAFRPARPGALPALRPVGGGPGQASETHGPESRPGGAQLAPGALPALRGPEGRQGDAAAGPGTHGAEVPPGGEHAPGMPGSGLRPGEIPASRGPESRPGGVSPAPGALPALRGPEGRPGGAAAGPGPHGPEVPPGGEHAPGAPPVPRPGEGAAMHGPETRPGGAPPALHGPENRLGGGAASHEGRPEPVRPVAPAIQVPHVEPPHPAEPPHPVAPPQMQAPRMEPPHVEPPHPQPRPEMAPPPRPEPMSRPEPPRPAPQVHAPPPRAPEGHPQGHREEQRP